MYKQENENMTQDNNIECGLTNSKPMSRGNNNENPQSMINMDYYHTKPNLITFTTHTNKTHNFKAPIYPITLSH